ncbi:APC family permease [Nonomuraea gerenzanensis]|uniref:Cationic amino acid transporter n=1 Tax=Nonomuraea gerenzanensis TaxID=93944 RepID=A0A1M4DX25_9ACTN|nr:amino acid permease [Nonomuraea gerenzanensis]UBU13423.1 amino acid permease [Nonomuraea gerenzanensis]SBO91084.1 cationic amino acid transporter [Nonomuraea gerenzanensis]
MSTILRRLPPSEATGLRTGARHSLAEVYRPADLVVLGLGVMIGAGIFSIAGEQAATTAGPGVILSFMIAGIACLLACLCYAELSSTMPTSGSAYTFTYVIFGEVWAWIIGWALILELQFAAAVVARAWAAITVGAVEHFGVRVPAEDLVQDVLVFVILVLLTGIVALGARVGLRALWIMVSAKLLAIGAVIVVGLTHIDVANFGDFYVPPKTLDAAPATVLEIFVGESQAFGWFGVFAAASAIAFAYIGFDIVATSAEETANAPRAVPKGMIRSLVVATVLYLAVALVMVGMVSYTKISVEAPLASAFRAVGVDWMVHVIDAGAVLGLTTVILVLIVGQTRVLFSMARDGLIPRGLATVSRRYHTPTRVTLVIGLVAIVLAEFVPVLTMQQLVVIGTLFAFAFVAAGVIVMRRRMPHLERGFRVPLSPLLPALSLVATLWLMVNLRVLTWAWFALWMAFGLLVYLGYGRRHSLLARPSAPARQPHGRHRR